MDTTSGIAIVIHWKHLLIFKTCAEAISNEVKDSRVSDLFVIEYFFLEKLNYLDSNILI